MKISIQSSELNNIINIALKGISSRTTLAILNGFLLEAKENILSITSSDLELGIRTFTRCEVYEEGSIVLGARFFSDLIKKLPNENVLLESHPDLSVHISCLSSEFNIMGMDPMEFPQLPTIEKKNQLSMSSMMLSSMIKQSNFATSDDDAKPILKGALFEIEENQFKMVALDGYRLAYRREDLRTDIQERFVVPSKTLSEIQKLLEDDENIVQISFNNSHILFEIGKTIFVSRLLQGQFLNYKDVIQINTKTKITVNLRNFKHSLDRASLFAKDGKNNCVRFEIKDGKMEISSKSELGNVHEELPIEKEGENLIIAFNAKYMTDGIKNIDSEEITLEFVSNINPCIIKPKEDSNYLYLILPVRLTEA